jgi:hypothetical protein
MHDGKKIGLKPMTPEQILKDDLARASRAKKMRRNLKAKIRLLLQILHPLNMLVNLILVTLLKFI